MKYRLHLQKYMVEERYVYNKIEYLEGIPNGFGL